MGPAPDDERPCDVSFVVTSRNDDFGGRMLSRLRLCAENLLQLANRHGLRGELIVVEWNPPPGPRLSDALELDTDSDVFAVRFIEAPPEAHARLRNSDVIPLFQMIAKNVGIRRARGRFICATNQDILLSDELMSFLASGRLDPGAMYRLDRTDVRAEVPEGSVDAQIRWCRDNVLRVHGKQGTFQHAWWTPPGRRAFLTQDWGSVLAAKWAHVRWPKRPLKSAVFFARLLARLPFAAAVRVLDPRPVVHTNGCGDFTLMARERWLRLRGYAELELFSMHLDSLLCYTALGTGLREEVVPYPAQIFHLEHGSSWAVMTSDERLRTFALKPWIDYNLVIDLWHRMRQGEAPVQFNPPDWGLGGAPLREVVVLSGRKRVCDPARPAPAP